MGIALLEVHSTISNAKPACVLVLRDRSIQRPEGLCSLPGFGGGAVGEATADPHSTGIASQSSLRAGFRLVRPAIGDDCGPNCAQDDSGEGRVGFPTHATETSRMDGARAYPLKRSLDGASSGIPGLRIEISTPRTKTCPRGPEPGAPSARLAMTGVGGGLVFPTLGARKTTAGPSASLGMTLVRVGHPALR